jgi:hypothetical protein
MPVTPTFCARRSTGASASPAVGAGRHSAPARGPARWSTWRLATWTPSCRTVGATTAARLAVLVGSSVPTPSWSTACRWCAVWPRIRYGRDADAHGRPLERAACWGSSPPSGRCRWGRCRSSPACSAPAECPTSALNPPPVKPTSNRLGEALVYQGRRLRRTTAQRLSRPLSATDRVFQVWPPSCERSTTVRIRSGARELMASPSGAVRIDRCRGPCNAAADLGARVDAARLLAWRLRRCLQCSSCCHQRLRPRVG